MIARTPYEQICIPYNNCLELLAKLNSQLDFTSFSLKLITDDLTNIMGKEVAEFNEPEILKFVNENILSQAEGKLQMDANWITLTRRILNLSLMKVRITGN